MEWCGGGGEKEEEETTRKEESLDVAGEASFSDWLLGAGLSYDLKLTRSWHHNGSVIEKTARGPILISLRLSLGHGQRICTCHAV